MPMFLWRRGLFLFASLSIASFILLFLLPSSPFPNSGSSQIPPQPNEREKFPSNPDPDESTQTNPAFNTFANLSSPIPSPSPLPSQPGLSPSPIPPHEQHSFGHFADPTKPGEHTAAENGENIAAEELLIAVVTRPSATDRRDALRRLYRPIDGRCIEVADRHNKNSGYAGDRKAACIVVRYRFFVGVDKDEIANQEILKEMARYNDMVKLADAKETYYLLFRKILQVFKWIVQERPHVKYVFKVDDDVYVRLDRLVQLVHRMPDQSKGKLQLDGKAVYFGRILVRQPAIRLPNYVWKIPKAVLPENTIPFFIEGAAYVISTNLLPPLLRATTDICEVVPDSSLDDVGMARMIGNAYPELEYYDVPGFLSPLGLRACTEDFVTLHYSNPEVIRTLILLDRDNSTVCCPRLPKRPRANGKVIASYGDMQLRASTVVLGTLPGGARCIGWATFSWHLVDLWNRKYVASTWRKENDLDGYRGQVHEECRTPEWPKAPKVHSWPPESTSLEP